MTPATIIQQATADGIRLAPTTKGTIKVIGDRVVVARWLPVVRYHKQGILVALRQALSTSFCFSPPSDPTSEDHAFQEQAVIMMEANGWDEATALQEARWQSDRERCWQGFLLNADLIQKAPKNHREALLTSYQEEAGLRYGEATARDMAKTMWHWIQARGVH